MNVEKHLKLLGIVVEDKVTGFKGTVTSIAFDLFGCIQAIVTPFAGKEGKVEDSRWFDVQRLIIKKKNPVMDMPDFGSVKIAEGKKGPIEKPAGKW